MALNRPSEADYASVHNYMNGDRSPLIENEASWVFKKEDLITLRAGREHAWLDSAIEKILKWFHCPALEMIFGDEVCLLYLRATIDTETHTTVAYKKQVPGERSLLLTPENRQSSQLDYNADGSHPPGCAHLPSLPSHQ
jgi:hypothetical protein